MEVFECPRCDGNAVADVWFTECAHCNGTGLLAGGCDSCEGGVANVHERYAQSFQDVWATELVVITCECAKPATAQQAATYHAAYMGRAC